MYDSEPVQQSMLTWIISALGPIYAILLPLSALIGFLLALVLVIRGKGPMSAAALVLIVHLPLMIGLFAALQGMLSAFRVIASSPSTPKPSELAEGYSMALIAPIVALLLMAPSYCLAAFGAFIQAMRSGAGNDRSN